MTVARQVSSLAGALLLASCSLHAQATQVQYTVEVAAAKSAVFHITMQFTAQSGTLRLAMPASTPGEIDIKNHARYVMRLEAFDQQARSLAVRRFDKQTWLIDVQKTGTVAIHYDVRPNTRDTLRLGTSWLQENGGSIEPASLFLYLSDHLDLPISLRLKLPNP